MTWWSGRNDPVCLLEEKMVKNEEKPFYSDGKHLLTESRCFLTHSFYSFRILTHCWSKSFHQMQTGERFFRIKAGRSVTGSWFCPSAKQEFIFQHFLPGDVCVTGVAFCMLLFCNEQYWLMVLLLMTDQLMTFRSFRDDVTWELFQLRGLWQDQM